MAKFRVLTTSFIDNRLVHEGDVVEYTGVAADNLEPLDPPAEQLSTDGSGVLVGDMVRQKLAAQGGDPDAVDTAAALNAAEKAASGVLSTQQPAAQVDASALL